MAAKPEDMLEHCDGCSGELELGQIGKCDSCQEAENGTSYTHCVKCGAEWPENEVPRVSVGAGTVGAHSIEGCDNCGTDEHLIDTDEPVSATA